jgi:CRP-like cAMP-binding protein
MLAEAGVDEAELRRRCRRRRFERGEVVFHAGDPAGAFHFIDRGVLAVRLTTPLGDVVVLELLRAGGTLGEQALVDGTGERTATVVAVERSETLSLDRASFDQLRAEHPPLDRFLLGVVSQRLRRANGQLLEVLFLPAEVRILRCVWRLAVEAGPGETLTLTQGDLAAMTGVTRSTANRVLRQAQDDGLLRMARGRIEVLDGEALRRRGGYR